MNMGPAAVDPITAQNVQIGATRSAAPGGADLRQNGGDARLDFPEGVRLMEQHTER
jgi:hypothetical protein